VISRCGAIARDSAPVTGKVCTFCVNAASVASWTSNVDVTMLPVHDTL
jgi:hypothetical protein